MDGRFRAAGSSMKTRLAIILLGALAAGLLFGLMRLFQWRLSSGDLFPVYSSFRDDPLGVGVLHDALAQMPEMRVDRNLEPLAGLPERPSRTLVLAGTASEAWSKVTRQEFDALNAAVRSGSRLVVAFRAERAEKPKPAESKPVTAPATEKDGKAEKSAPEPRLPVFADLRRHWGAAPRVQPLPADERVAIRSEEGAPTSLPAQIRWAGDTHFELDAAAGWRVLYRRGGLPVLMERTLGKGSIVLAADSYFLSNEALQRDRSTTLLAWVVGPLRRVTFDESHLGVVAHTGVAALIRKYGLWATAVSLLVVAGLFAWQRSALFIPAPPDAEDVALTYHPAAGLHSLLRRAVPPTEVVAASVAEWRQTARDTDRRRADGALAVAPKDASPPERYNCVVRALRKR